MTVAIATTIAIRLAMPVFAKQTLPQLPTIRELAPASDSDKQKRTFFVVANTGNA